MPVSRDWDFARDKKTLEHGKKLARMHEWSWFRVQTPGDGNCAFHALAQNMKRLRYIWTIMNWDDTTLSTLPMSASAWRHACVSFIEKYAVILDINKIWTESSPGWRDQVLNQAVPCTQSRICMHILATCCCTVRPRKHILVPCLAHWHAVAVGAYL